MGHLPRSVAVVLTAGLLAALSSAAAYGESNTPPVRSTATELESGLLGPGELAKVPGLPKLHRRSLEKAGVYEDPDPRGPCGAVVQPLPVSEGATRIFAGDGVVVAQTVLRPGATRARRAMAQVLADAWPGCAPYQSVTNEGEIQTVTPRIVALPPVGDERSGVSGYIEIDGDRTYIGGLSLRRKGLVASVAILSLTPVSDGTVRSMAKVVDRALTRLQ